MDAPADKEQLAQQLFQQGQVAFEAEQHQQAHMLWQQAAHLTPKNIFIWQALLKVVDNDADRIICLQNILRLDPGNEHAKWHLRVLNFMNPGLRHETANPAGQSGMPDWLETAAHFGIYAVVLIVLFSVGLLIGIILNML